MDIYVASLTFSLAPWWLPHFFNSKIVAAPNRLLSNTLSKHAHYRPAQTNRNEGTKQSSFNLGQSRLSNPKDEQDQLENKENLNKNVEIMDTMHLQIKFMPTLLDNITLLYIHSLQASSVCIIAN